MSKPSKATPLALLILLVTCIVMVLPASVQSIPKPSVPEFTVEYVDESYDVPPTYEKDQYTGQQVITYDGYHVDHKTIVFTIKNQPFTTYNDSEGNAIGLYYNFRFKGTYGDEWTYYPFHENISTRIYGGALQLEWSLPKLFSLKFSGNCPIDSFKFRNPLRLLSSGSSSNPNRLYYGHMVSMAMGSSYEFTGQSSDWSNTKTIEIPSNVPSSQTPTPPPTMSLPIATQPPSATKSPTESATDDFSMNWLAIGAIAGLGVFVALMREYCSIALQSPWCCGVATWCPVLRLLFEDLTSISQQPKPGADAKMQLATESAGR